jgi:hypothetical protein
MTRQNNNTHIFSQLHNESHPHTRRIAVGNKAIENNGKFV